ncbi:MAG: hypothetical protein K1X74_04360 [Pirellulales bacterium]|nr:hypothetical protein [Pirellulales bacterium]
MRTKCFKWAIVLLTLGTALAAVELHYRRRPARSFWTVAELLSTSADKKLPLTFDRELGFRPCLDGSRYTPTGTQLNGYPLVKAPDVTRVLFVGDSATARGQLLESVKQLYGAGPFEFWNAGVDGFDPSQVRAYYERYNYRVAPDHVVLVLHNNDFSSQPVLNPDDRGHLTIHSPGGAWRVRLPWLLRHSAFVQRKFVQLWLERREALGPARVETELAALARRVAADGASFSVVVLPILKPLDRWSAQEVSNRQQALAICEHLKLRYFDPLPGLQQALAAGVDPSERPGDSWHPGMQGAAYLAAQLARQELLGPVGVRGRDNELVANRRLR